MAQINGPPLTANLFPVTVYSTMDLKELTEEMQRFVTAKGWYAADSNRPQTRRNIAASLVVESAEVLEHFQWSDASPDPADLGAELADVALYLLQLASLCDVDLEQAIRDKLQANYERTWE